MTKRVFIIHGWDGYPTEAWMPWLKKELEQRGFVVEAPNMPQPDEPTIETWVPKVAEVIGEPDENTYVVGHSIGCRAILHYLESLDGKKVGGAILVAPGFRLENLEEEGEEVVAIAKPWLEAQLDFNKIRQATPNITAILSDNDPYNALDYNKQKLSELGAEIVVEHNKGHFSEDSGVKELPSALNAILKYDQSSRK